MFILDFLEYPHTHHQNHQLLEHPHHEVQSYIDQFAHVVDENGQNHFLDSREDEIEVVYFGFLQSTLVLPHKEH